MKYEVLVLDLDNTLIDFDIMEERSLEAAFKDYNIEITDKLLDDYYKINKKMWEDLEKGLIEQKRLLVKRFEVLFEKYAIEVSAKDFNQKYLGNMPSNAVFLDGAEDFLVWAKDRYTLVMMTNGFKDVQRKKIKILGLEQYFDHILISGEVGYEKPMKGIYDYLFELIAEVSKEKVLVVGDSLSADVKGGNDYGLDTVWFNKRNKDMDSPAKYEVKNIQGLYEVVQA